MARYEGDLRGRPKAALTLEELLTLVGEPADGDTRSRDDAIACYLSGADGWREAVKKLGGAFADDEGTLRERKDD